ncbi:hypothetical protein L2722_00245 [Lactobacillus gasseri]|nr:hypothetical protein [Lactobacillus gasseri]MCZ3668559.1 hypothetical protein [Lactobacillus gasseri]
MTAIIDKTIAIIEIVIFFFVFLSMEELTLTFYEIISVIVASLAFLLSLYSAINTYYEKHIKTKVYIRWVHKASTQLNISLLISNMSSRPATLTHIFLENNDDTVESSWHHARLLSQTIDNNEKICWSDVTPINIPARSSSNPIICFQHLNNFKLTNNLVLIYIVDGVKHEQSFNVNRILQNSEMLIALDYQLKHN